MENKVISKELLSEILDEAGDFWQINTFKIIRKNELYIELGTFDEDFNQVSINIHELAHKCKEWAFNEYLFIISSEKHACNWCAFANNEVTKTSKEFYEPSEPEAIFKACQWIKDNK